MAGYTRQAAANIAAGLTISAADHNAEYNQIQAAFDGSSGHTHTGGSGNGPKIPLTTSVSGTLPFANGGTGATAFTNGSVVFSNGTTLTQDNTNFFWDDTNNYLGLGGATTPVDRLQLHATTAIPVRLRITNSNSGATATDGFACSIDATSHAYVWNYENTALHFATNNIERLLINSNGTISIGNTRNTTTLDVTGTANITSNTTIGGNLGVTGTLGAGNTTITGDLVVTDDLQVNDDVLISGDLGVTGAVTLGIDLPVSEGGTGASTAAAAFANIAVSASSLVSPGYIKLTNGLILQWGFTTFVASASAAVLFPIAFPVAAFNVFLTTGSNAFFPYIAAGPTTTGFTYGMSGATSITGYWFAIGV